MVYEICAAVATVAFVALVIYIILTLQKVGKLIEHLDANIEPLSLETQKLLQNTNDKFAAMNPLFDSLSDVGNAFQRVTSSLSEKVAFTEEKKAVKKVKLKKSSSLLL